MSDEFTIVLIIKSHPILSFDDTQFTHCTISVATWIAFSLHFIVMDCSKKHIHPVCYGWSHAAQIYYINSLCMRNTCALVATYFVQF